jgi:hypothetical protein
MATLDGPLWEYNLIRVVFLDVSDDYRLMQPPMRSDCYPVLQEAWLPRHRLMDRLSNDEILAGYLYDWHEPDDAAGGLWYVGVVREDLLSIAGA